MDNFVTYYIATEPTLWALGHLTFYQDPCLLSGEVPCSKHINYRIWLHHSVSPSSILTLSLTYSVVCWWRPRETKEGAFSIQPNCWRPTVLIWSELNWECESCWYLDDHHIVQHPAKPSSGGTLESLTLEAEQQPAGRYWLGTSSNVTTPAPAARSSPAPGPATSSCHWLWPDTAGVANSSFPYDLYFFRGFYGLSTINIAECVMTL